MKYNIDNRGNAYGECNEKPEKYNIQIFLLREGYHADNIEVWFNEKSNTWKWKSDILEV